MVVWNDLQSVEQQSQPDFRRIIDLWSHCFRLTM